MLTAELISTNLISVISNCNETFLWKKLFQSGTVISKSHIISYCNSETYPDIQKHPSELFCKKGVLRNFTKYTWKHLCQSLFFNKVAGLMASVHSEVKQEMSKILLTQLMFQSIDLQWLPSVWWEHWSLMD